MPSHKRVEILGPCMRYAATVVTIFMSQWNWKNTKGNQNLSISDEENLVEHVEDVAGRLVDRGHDRLVVVRAEGAKGLYHPGGEGRVQARRRLLHMCCNSGFGIFAPKKRHQSQRQRKGMCVGVCVSVCRSVCLSVMRLVTLHLFAF